ncbi:MAG TPA: hypothetical protein VMA75_03500 [Candidatus Paceibacterota bacterium]|nr:hypothetical protein [Candidatus Paceibacterota bacterium]
MGSYIENFKENAAGKYTFRLFDEPTFLKGFTSLFDFREIIDLYHTDKTTKEADLNSLKSDWKAVGDDLRSAITENAPAAHARA